MNLLTAMTEGERKPPRESGSREERNGLQGRGHPGPEVGLSPYEDRFMTPLLVRFPRLKRQLHPWLIHFPITFMISATSFSLLYLLTGVASFKTTAFHCLAAGVLFLPGAIWSGLLTERINFPEAPRSARIERIISSLLAVVSLAAFIWGLVNPEILNNLHGLNLIYLFLILALTPLVVAAGYFGGLLTFPLDDQAPGATGAGNYGQPRP